MERTTEMDCGELDDVRDVIAAICLDVGVDGTEVDVFGRCYIGFQMAKADHSGDVRWPPLSS